MSYAETHRSQKNKHDFTGYVDHCIHCGDSVWDLPECLSELFAVKLGMRHMGGCVALPAPAVSAPERDNLPRVSEETR